MKLYGRLCLAILAISAAAPGLFAQATRPTEVIAMDSCVRADCHADVKAHAVVHGPVNVNACDACHQLKSAREHTFDFTRDKSSLCTFCHQVALSDPVVHKPVAQGDCLSCHEPHGGNSNRFIRGQTTKELCQACHQDTTAGRKHLHGPVAAGVCEACHKSHSSAYPKLLVDQGRELCLSCHTEMKNQLATVKFTHKAVEGECTQCHDAHASDYVMQIKEPPLQLCTSCHEHEKIKEAAENAKYKHSVVTRDQACLNCHTAHGSDLAKLLKAQPLEVCMQCHDRTIRSADGRTVASVAEVLNPQLNKHGPIREGNCSGCHNVHGSEVQRLLTMPYPAAFYSDFSEENYALCFSCHDRQLVELEKTTGLTSFRNGQENLHFVHVNKNARGRTCRACHATHASSLPQHLRTSVPYGNWSMPIGFVKTETGGSCSPGCHKPYAYDRNNPVSYERPKAGAS